MRLEELLALANGQNQYPPMLQQQMLQQDQFLAPYADPASIDRLMAQAKRIQQLSVEPRKTGMMPFLTNLIGDIGTARLRSSQSPMAQQFGAMGQTSMEREAERMTRVPKIENLLTYLQHAENQRAINKHHADMLEETSRHHKAQEGMQSSYYGMQSKKLLRELGDEESLAKFRKQYPDALPIASMPADTHNKLMQDMIGRVNAPEVMAPIIEKLEELQGIVTKYPRLWEGMAYALNGDTEKRGAFNQLKRKLSDPGEIDALHKMQIISNDLILKKVAEMAASGAGMGRMNMFIERMVALTKPGVQHSPEVIAYAVDSAKKTQAQLEEQREYALPALQAGFYVGPKRTHSNKVAQNENTDMKKLRKYREIYPELDKFSDEKVLNVINTDMKKLRKYRETHPELDNFSDEKVLNVIKRDGY